jgi:hypothetical protein
LRRLDKARGGHREPPLLLPITPFLGTKIGASNVSAADQLASASIEPAPSRVNRGLCEPLLFHAIERDAKPQELSIRVGRISNCSSRQRQRSRGRHGGGGGDKSASGQCGFRHSFISLSGDRLFSSFRESHTAWEAACKAAGLPRIAYGSVPDDEYRAHQLKRSAIRTEEEELAEEELADSVSVWDKILDPLFKLVHEILPLKASTPAGLAVQAKAVVLVFRSRQRIPKSA